MPPTAPPPGSPSAQRAAADILAAAIFRRPKLRAVFGVEACCKAVWPRCAPLDDVPGDKTLAESLERKARDTAADLVESPDAAWTCTQAGAFEFHATRTHLGIYVFVMLAGDTLPQLIDETILPIPPERRSLSIEELAARLGLPARA